MSAEYNRRLIIKRLGELCNYHEELCREKDAVEAKIYSVSKLLLNEYEPEKEHQSNSIYKGFQVKSLKEV